MCPRSEERAGAVDEDCTDEVSSGAGGEGAGSPSASPPPSRDDDLAHPWPSMQDLNTRLRRLITAYQRNYKREELKMQQKAKVIIIIKIFVSKLKMFTLHS